MGQTPETVMGWKKTKATGENKSNQHPILTLRTPSSDAGGALLGFTIGRKKKKHARTAHSHERYPTLVTINLQLKRENLLAC